MVRNFWFYSYVRNYIYYKDTILTLFFVSAPIQKQSRNLHKLVVGIKATTHFADQILPATTKLSIRATFHHQTQKAHTTLNSIPPLKSTQFNQTSNRVPRLHPPISLLRCCSSTIARYKREAKWEFPPRRSIA
ncbi:unnamed protein product [Citrullus colocynthis]|uniref:Uncharacterized protein n=1 Tax=Citrullus colocynthis TaxID=252529 RepID=A0ABP0XTS3_9ROSI